MIKHRHGCGRTCNFPPRKRKSIKGVLWYTTENMDSFSSLTSKPSEYLSKLKLSNTDRNGIIKVCDEFPGFTRFKMHKPFGVSSPQKISVPRSHAKHPTDTIPDASDASIRKAVSTFLPKFENKELFNHQLCWCTDTADAALLICEHAQYKNLILATGDSGHSFKLLPNIGKHVVELMEGSLSETLRYAWRWRPGEGDALRSRRGAPAKDLADMPGWRHDGESNGDMD